MLELRIRREPDPESPRDFDNLGVMVCWHPKYKLGDIQLKGREPSHWAADIPKGSVILPLFLYDHSGITMSTEAFSCPWDSGKVGFIYATPEKIRETFGVERISKKRRLEAEEMLRTEVGLYANYLEGNVWTFQIFDENGEVDGGGDFYGSTLQETNIKKFLLPEVLAQAEEAWERRFDDEQA
jgi:hypothetical protein